MKYGRNNFVLPYPLRDRRLYRTKHFFSNLRLDAIKNGNCSNRRTVIIAPQHRFILCIRTDDSYFFIVFFTGNMPLLFCNSVIDSCAISSANFLCSGSFTTDMGILVHGTNESSSRLPNDIRPSITLSNVGQHLFL